MLEFLNYIYMACGLTFTSLVVVFGFVAACAVAIKLVEVLAFGAENFHH